jgi:hypothetical protein
VVVWPHHSLAGRAPQRRAAQIEPLNSKELPAKENFTVRKGTDFQILQIDDFPDATEQ